MGHEFKVGDKARVVGKTYYGHAFEIGEVVSVLNVYSRGDVKCEGASGCHQILRPSDLEPIPAAPKTWGEMTDTEKGALMLAWHEGKTIQSNASGAWTNCDPQWLLDKCYRVKPEPVRVTVDLMADGKRIGTIDLIDGKPDVASIKLEGA